MAVNERHEKPPEADLHMRKVGRGIKCRGILYAREPSFRFQVRLRRSYEAAPAIDAASSGINLKRKIAKEALAVCWWRACEELGVPMPDNSARLKSTGFVLHPDQNDHRSSSRDRRCRVHGDAQLAMVSSAVDRVDVGHLDHGKQRQQNQTRQSCHTKSARLSAAIFAH
jgi:hypothetical protein